MRPLVFAMIAMCSYAAQNVIIERRLTSVSPLMLVAVTSGTVFFLAIATILVKQRAGMEVPPLSREELQFAVACGLLLFLADNAFFSAYNAGGTLVVMTTVPLTLPVIASLMKYVTMQTGAPTTATIMSWVLAALSVYLISLT